MSGKNYKRVVIKLGSSTVTGLEGRLDHTNLAKLVDQVAGLRLGGIECLIVTSGAIAAGLEQLNLPERPKEIAKLQAAAAVGQGLLMHEYTGLFRKYGLTVAQVLLTQFDMAHRELYLNARRAVNQMLAMETIPVINENDTTVVEEIRFGDNDTIAALVAVLVQADLLIILSDIDGFYGADPRKDRSARRIPVIEEITDEVEAMAEGIGSKFGSGGMITKINAARLVGAAKIGMYIADGRQEAVLEKIMAGRDVGTYFAPRRRKVPGRKLWIGYGRMVRGRVTVDRGAADAILKDGRSLLPAGVVGLDGDFVIGDTIEVSTVEGQVFARGLSNYAAAELDNIKGKRSKQIAEEFEGEFSEEVIHRDFMVIL